MREGPPEAKNGRFRNVLSTLAKKSRNFTFSNFFRFFASCETATRTGHAAAKKAMVLKIQNFRNVSPPLRNRDFARNAARAARSAPSLFRRAGATRRAENDVGCLAPFPGISIRFSTFPLRGLLARRLASHRVVVAREMQTHEATATSHLKRMIVDCTIKSHHYR